MCLIFAMTVGPVGREHGQRGVFLQFWQASSPVHYQEVQHDRRPTESLEPHGRRGPKYSRRTLVEETLGLWKEGQGPIGNWLEKG